MSFSGQEELTRLTSMGEKLITPLASSDQRTLSDRRSSTAFKSQKDAYQGKVLARATTLSTTDSVETDLNPIGTEDGH